MQLPALDVRSAAIGFPLASRPIQPSPKIRGWAASSLANSRGACEGGVGGKGCYNAMLLTCVARNKLEHSFIPRG